MNLPDYIDKVGNCDALCSYISEYIKKEHIDKQWLKRRAVINSINVSRRCINQFVGIGLPGEAMTYPNADKVDLDEYGGGGPQYPVEILTILTAGTAVPDRRAYLESKFPCYATL